MNPQTNINYNSLTSTQRSFFGWDVSGGSNFTLLNYGIKNYYPDPSGVLINASTRFVSLEKNVSINKILI